MESTFIEPMLCLHVKSLPSGDQWCYEMKFDGHRVEAVKQDRCVALFSGEKKDLTSLYPCIADALGDLPGDTIVDGELVALDKKGLPSLTALENATMTTPVVYYAFDLLRLNGRDLLKKPLSERREILKTRLMPGLAREVRFSETFSMTAEAMIQSVKAQSQDGVIAKRVNSVYEPGQRTGNWVTMRVGNRSQKPRKIAPPVRSYK